MEHHAHDEDGAADSAEIGKPIVLGALPAEYLAERGLQRAGIVEQLEIAIGGDVGRDGERQQQKPLKQTSPRKAAHRDKPSSASADQQG